MTRATCHAVLGLGCVVAKPLLAEAAQWSVAPTFTWGVDTDSNRYLTYPARASQSTWLFTSWQLQHASETMQLSLSPTLRWQTFDVRQYGDIFDRILGGSLSWEHERWRLDMSGSVANESTLTTELTETGIASNDLNRRTNSVSGTWTFSQTERRSLVLQAAYTDTSYSGPQAGVSAYLVGYRYPNGFIGEQLQLTERDTLTPSAFYAALRSDIPQNDSRETGGQVDWVHNFTERMRLDIALGASDRSLAGTRSTGTVATVDFTRTSELGHVSFDYSRRLVPYGTGVLAQRTQYTLSVARNLSETFDVDASLLRIENNKYTVLLRLDRPSYTGVTAGLNWRPLETLRLRLEASGTDTQTLEIVGQQPLHEWRAALLLTWTPYPISRTF